jgi:hypothetical protein
MYSEYAFAVLPFSYSSPLEVHVHRYQLPVIKDVEGKFSNIGTTLRSYSKRILKSVNNSSYPSKIFSKISQSFRPLEGIVEK